MSKNLRLLPTPRQLTLTGGSYPLTDRRMILLSSESPQTLRSAALRFQKALADRCNLNWELTASAATPTDLLGLTLHISADENLPAQGYTLSISPAGIRVEAADASGIFYGVCTLIQILEQRDTQLPCLHISDWPDFPARGVMLDISRDKVPTMETILSLVDMLAGWKINQFQLYTEHTFAYRRHAEVWAQASPFTGQEILELDAFCRERHIELVPNQNSFGHMNRWLIHPRYLPLAEAPEGFQTPWGEMHGPFSLAPLVPGSLELVTGLYDELLPHFSSRMVNVGCDETWDLGQGRSKEIVAQRGAGRVYLDFLLKIYQDVSARGFAMQFWGDIIIQHPDLIPELPKDLIALEWGYEADHPFAEHGAKFAATGIPFYVCPGTSAWNSIAGRTDNALGNLINAAENGLKHGAVGYLNTDWGDNGHWQVFPVSFLGYAAGAAYSWALEANRNLDLPTALDLHAFHDRAGVMGQLAYDLGNVYRAVGIEPGNSSYLFWVFQTPLEKLRANPAEVDFHAVSEKNNAIIGEITRAEMGRPDADLIVKEFELASWMLHHACWRGILATEDVSGLASDLDSELQDLIAEHKRIWLKRNRSGGLADSIARFEKARQDYRQEEK